MKRTRRKNILRDVRGSLNRFLSILFIVALGSGFMAGLAATSPDMYATADKYMDDYDWYDLDVKSTMGFTEEDVDAVEALGRTQCAQGARVMDLVLMDKAEGTHTSRVYAILPESGESVLNKVKLTQGMLPQSTDECVIQTTSGRYFDGSIEIGDKLTVYREDSSYDDIKDSIAAEELTVVGFVESPMSISVTQEASTAGSGRISVDVFVLEGYFKFDYYTDIFVTLKGAATMNTFDDEYRDLVDEAVPEFEALGEERAPIRTEQVKAQAREQLDELREYAGTLVGTAQVQQALAQDTATRLRENAAAAAIVGKSSPELGALLEETGTLVQESLMNMGKEDPETVLAGIEASVDESEKAIEDMPQAAWVIRTRSDASGYSAYDSNVGKVAALSKIFPVFFFLVALLVALTTMTRLVEENRGQIGTLKALGYTNGQVLGEYILYSLFSSVLGCALGFAVGFRLFPKAISSAYGMMFTVPETETPFRLNIAVWVAPVTVCSILLATLWVCWSEFRACPAELMQPKAPAAGKRIWLEHIPFVWKRLSFTHKVTCRNLFRYKKRFFMTVIGVAGCSALLLTGFGIRDSVNDIVDKQFGEIYRYEVSAILDSAEAPAQDEQLKARLADTEQISSWTVCDEESGKASEGKNSEKITICVPADREHFSEFITLRDRKSGESVPFPAEGAVLTEKLCEQLGVKAGDTVTLENADGVHGEVRVAGITENYLASYAYISQETYRTAFGDEPEMKMLLCRLAEGAQGDDMTTELMECSGVVYASSSQTLRENFSDSIKSIDGVVLVLILAAGLLCIVVLYNLTNVNICERRKELATIRVLGFHEGEVERYIFRETNTLSFIGAVMGLFIGIWLHSYVVRTVEVDMVMFGRNIYPRSYAFALLISVVFTILVNCIMRRQIRKVDMVEAMKAND